MLHEFALKRRVEFHETDMAGLVHFSNFFRYMEATEHAFLNEAGFPPVKQEKAMFWGWPRVNASCDYRGPLKFGDTFECRLFVRQIKIKSVVYFFRFRKLLGNGDSEPVAKGQMTAVYAEFNVGNGTMGPLDLSAELLSRIQECPDPVWRGPDKG
ncbi:MAG: acyl-CoA thioesterase [Verrucomicrobiota bacterium]